MTTSAHAQTFQPAKWLSRLSTSLAGLLLFSSAALAHNVDTASIVEIRQNGGIATNLKPGVDATIRLTFRNEGKNNAVVGFNNPGQCNAGYATDGSVRGPEYSNAPFNENPDVFIQTTAIPAQFEISGPLPANCVNQGAGTVDGVVGTVIQCTVTQPAGLPNGKLAPGLESAAPVDIPVTVRGTVGNNIQIPNVLSYPLQTQQQIGDCNNAANDAAPKAQYTLVATTGQALSGFVYLDQNNNGIKDATEPVFPNVNLTLSGTSYGGNAVAGGGDDRALTVADGLTATTDANGFYSFTIVNPGSYTVTEQNAQPVYNTVTTVNGITTAGTVTIGTPGTAVAQNVIPSAIANIIMLTNGASPNNNFGELLPGSIGGKVFLDNNNDGILNGADAGIAGVAMTLTGTNDLGNPISATTNTLADGTYSFNGLRPGNYLITEGAQPANTINGFANAGTIDGVTVGTVNNSAVVTPTGTGRIDNIVLSAGKNSINNNFGETVLSSISGRVFLDQNNDGVFNGVDSGLVVPLTLTGIDDLGATVNTVINSNADGTYTFPNLRPSNGAGYTVTEGTQPANSQNGKTIAGTIDGVSKGNATPVTTTPSAIAGIVLIGGKAAINNDFAEIPTTGVISGKIFVDNNNDGLQGQSEANLAGYIVTLTGTDSNGQPVSKQVTTLADGTYAFTGLLPGNYQISYQPLAQDSYRNGRSVPGSLGGTASNPTTLSAITLTAGNLNSSANNFTRVGKASISGKVFLDLNNNGVLDSTTGDTPMAGITINLTGTDINGLAVNKTTTTDSTGAYQFLGLESGTYTVTEPSQPAGTQNGVTKVGTVNGVAKGVATASTVTPSAISNVVLTIGDASINNDFAEYVGATLNGSVWYDAGATRGILDGGDRGLSGWQVEVLDPTKPAGQQLVTTATTGADGKYSIPGLAPGVIYDVQFREPGSRVVYGKPVNGESGANKYSCNAATLTATSNGPATSGQQSSCVKSDGSALRVVLLPGSNLLEQSLPVDPSGVIYDSVTRAPIAGATVTLSPVGNCAGYNANQHLINASSYNITGNSASMTTGSNGFYQYLFSGAAPASCQFQLNVTAPAGYISPSSIIAPVNGVLTTPPAPGNYLVQPQASPPSAGQATTYYLLVNSGSGSQSILNNHIPLDPTQPAGFTVTKIGSAQSVELGDSLTYTVRVRLANGIVLPNVSVTDTLPAGFKYIKGTSRQLVNGVATVLADPVGDVGPVLTFNLGAIPQNSEATFSYRVRVGVGAQQGDGVNRAQASAGTIRSNVAQFKVTVTGGVFTQEACVLGKIFVDCNNNHIQDSEELGIPGVRLYIEDGTYLISDVEGKYSICGLTPRTHAIKVDKTTLPFGSRLTTSSNRNAGDANSLFMDLKNGELHRADFIEGSCSNTILEQVKARRANGETRAPQTERKIGNGFTFSSKPAAYPQQGTDSANQRAVKPRYPDIQCGPKDDSNAQCNTPVPQLQINPPSTQGGAHAQ